MGMDYRYLLFFEREACLDVLERLGEMAWAYPGHQTILALPDREVVLPFSGWQETGPRISWDDPGPTWDFMTTLSFEPDQAIDYYLGRLRRGPSGEGAGDDGGTRLDRQGRAGVGYIYLTVHNDMASWPSGTGEDLVAFEFDTPGSSMSVLFTESESIRWAFTQLLETCRGVYGLLDLEDWAHLFWWRGHEMDEQIPDAGLPLAEIERLVGRHD
jgi:hypothetical protein